MKPSIKQKEICKLIENQAKSWAMTNDLKSPTHSSDLDEEILKLNLVDEDDVNILSEFIDDLRYVIINISE